ncbi:MAG: GHKL domain-containing protein [Proteobacteria bacterium]|nr:MAG: GHKL domain-containing protein [Pseudomonadota bacterium]
MARKPELPEAVSAFGSKVEGLILFFVAAAWALLVLSSFKYISEPWFGLLIGSRIILLVAALALGSLRLIGNSKISLPAYFLACAIPQALLGALEGGSKLEFYQYVSYFLFLAALTYSGPLRAWFSKYAPSFTILLIAPLFLKSSALFADAGTIVFNFTTPIVIAFISLIIVRANSSRYTALTQNLELKNTILESERDRKKEVEAEVDRLKGKIQADSRMVAYAELAEQVYHDIRSPIQALDIASKLFDGLLPEERSFLEESVSRISAIVDDLGKKAEVQAPTSEITAQPVVPVLDSIQKIIAEKQVRLEQRSEKKISLSVELITDVSGVRVPQAIERILSNLIDNAIEAIEGKGSVCVQVDRNKENVFVTVKDTGSGISKENLSRIFDRGVSVGKRTGSGLGLFSSKQLALNMSGDLKVESTVGIGSEFTLQAPLLRE